MTVEIINSKYYPIYLGTGLLQQLNSQIALMNYSKVLVVYDYGASTHFEVIIKQLTEQTDNCYFLELQPGENNKSIVGLQTVWQKLIEIQADRKSLVINLGGGMVGDLGGFAAATFMRGIDFIQVPTTLLAQVDASIGGKVAINFSGIKNVVGAFHTPKAIFIDPSCLKTLPKRELLSGWAEVLKHGLIYSAEYWKSCARLSADELRIPLLTQIIRESIKIKQAIVENDPNENGSRRLLNFGHTLGHAFESYSHRLDLKERLLHGEAIILGMLGESYISHRLGLLSSSTLLEIENVFKNLGYITKLNIRYESSDLIDLIKQDKKSEAGKVNWTLLNEIGRASINHDVTEPIIFEAIDHLR